ncbi:MAG: LysR substrate-binding domain-containing protein [Pseudomonadales bacterium]
MNRLPPLSWLRAFEAAGRLESFRAAADLLHVTPSSISHQVASLESHLGQPLFQRTGRGVRLTREGRAYLARISAGFDELAAAADVLRPATIRSRLTVGAFPFLASEVLVPNLASLRARLPGVTLTVISDTDLAKLTHADPEQRADAIIRYGNGRFPGCRASKLTDVMLVPVAAPALVRAGAALVEALARHPRIVVAGPYDGWTAWASGSGATLPPAPETLRFDSYLSAMRATEQGLGVGLGIRPFIDGWLTQRRLCALDTAGVPAGQASYLVTARHSERRDDLDTLRDWLLMRFAGDG